jgi:formate hydrogenlyase subunit 4
LWCARKASLRGAKVRAFCSPIKDIIRLLRKGTVYSTTTGFIFRIAPAAYLASILMAVLMLPHGDLPGLISFEGDFVMFAYILGFGKFLMIIAALDTGSSFEGMGASREALFSMLIEPAFFIVMGSLALLTGHTSFYDIFNALHFGSHISYLIGVLAASVLLFIAMIENSRMPVDDPKTHLELTMIHEVMVLDNSGFDLGMILYATPLKFVMYGTLIANFFIGELALIWSIPAFFGIQMVFAVTAGMIESFMARFRMSHNPQFIFILTSVSLLLFFAVLLVMGKFN